MSIKNEEKRVFFEKTGYKAVDATIFVFSFLYDANRRNLRAFINTVLLLSIITISYLYIKEKTSTNEKIEEALIGQRKENSKVFTFLWAKNDSLLKDLKECNSSINRIYDKLLENNNKIEKK